MIPPAALLGYTTGGAVLTLVLPLGFFIVVMGAFYLVFTRPHTIPGHRERVLARPEAPDPGAAHPMAASAGFPTGTSAGGAEPLADRATPPAVGAAKDDDAAERGEDHAGSVEGSEES